MQLTGVHMDHISSVTSKSPSGCNASFPLVRSAVCVTFSTQLQLIASDPVRLLLGNEHLNVDVKPKLHHSSVARHCFFLTALPLAVACLTSRTW